jgi:hypothetical protein
MTCGFFYFFQSFIIFRKSTLSPSYFYKSDFPIQEIVVGDSVKFHSVLVKADEPKGVIVYFHGNRGHIQRWLGLTKALMKYDYDLLLVEYPEYGKSNAVLNQVNLELLAQASFQYAVSNYGYENTVIFGRSVGTGLASMLAVNPRVKVVILETPYYSLSDLIGRYAFFMPYKPLLKFEFESFKFIKETKNKVLIVHGTDDFVIPVNMARKLSEVNQENVTYLEIMGGSHNNLSNFAQYWQALDLAFSPE